MLNLMIVDDSNVIRRRIERIQDYTNRFKIVATASNGMDAIDLFKRTRPEVITMDLTMPEMEGTEAIEAIMAIDPNVDIIVVSALSDKATGIEALEKGARGFLCKPFSEKELIEALEELTEDRHA